MFSSSVILPKVLEPSVNFKPDCSKCHELKLFNVQKQALKFNARFYALSTNFNIFANPSFASYRLFSTICLSQKWPFCLPAFSLASLSPILEIVCGRIKFLKHPFLLPETKEITDKRNTFYCLSLSEAFNLISKMRLIKAQILAEQIWLSPIVTAS